MTICLGMLSNGVLFSGAWWLAGHGLRQVKTIDRLLAAAVLGFAWCLLGLEVLGTLGLLAIGPLCGWASAMFAAGLWARWRRSSLDTVPMRQAGKPEPWLMEALLAAPVLLWACAVLGMRSLLLPVKVVSDGPIYHLYFAARWWKAGRLFLVGAPFGENAATYFPANGDLWFTWLFASWGGDRLAKVGQTPFLVLAGAAAFRMARMLGAGRNASLIAVCWSLASMPLLLFTFEANVDTIFVACYLIAVLFFLRYVLESAGTPALAFGGMAAGLALGTKPVGLVFVGPLLVLFVGIIAARTRSFRATLAAVLVLASCLLPTSGFWFGRNMLLTGNPLYPLHLEVMGTTVLRGWYGREAMRYSPYYLPLADWRSLCDILLAVLDPRLAPVWFAAVAGGWAVTRTKRTREDLWVWALAGLALLNVALYWVLIPYRTQQRFMLQALGLAAVPLARLLDRSRWLAAAASALLALHLLTPSPWPVALEEAAIPWDLSQIIPNIVLAPLPVLVRVERSGGWTLELAPRASMALAIGTGCCAAIAVWGGLQDRRRPRLLSALGLVAMVVLAGLETGFLGADARQLFYPGFRDFYAGWLNLESRSGPAGARVAYAGTNIPYYLLGVGLRNDVRYVNVDGHRNWLMHDYHRAAALRGESTWPNSRPGWDRAHPDLQSWLANLDAEGIQLLVVTRVNPGEGAHNVADADLFPIERRWADSLPQLFEPLYGVKEKDPFFRLYRYRRNEQAGPS
jgi:hypothetical protein